MQSKPNINLSNLTGKTDAELQKLAQAMKDLAEKNKYSKLKLAFPDEGQFRRELYRPHLGFFKAGSRCRFRVIMGANRSGKSFTMATELAYHASGEYPHWWEGKVLKKPTTIWIIAESGALFRDSLQKCLFGNPGEEIGTGLLPLADKNNGIGIIDYSYMPGTPGGIGSCQVRHKKGHIVSIVIKTNEMGREQFQAAKVSVLAFDEEPREDIYVEALMRLMGAGSEPGIAMLAYTPMKGFSNVTLKFLPNGQFPDKGSPIDEPDKYICRVEWTDTPHLSEDDKRAMLAEIPANQRDARTRGIPTLGAGQVFPVNEEFICCPALKIPSYWPRVYGYDFGWKNTAAIWVAQDPTTKIKYVYMEYKQGEVADYVHAQCVKTKGEWIPGISDPSGGGRRDDGSLRVEFMRTLGLNLTPGYNSLNTGLSSLLHQLESGLLKIFNTCPKILAELRVYRYDPNNPNMPAKNQDDHLIDALRYADSRFDDIAMSEEDFNYDPDDDFSSIRNDNTRDPRTGY